MSFYKKIKKLFNNPKLFFKDAIEKRFFALDNVYKRYLPKKYKAYSKYTIISAVYNVEKYLDDYFNSIINQRLDFKNNIFMILVDDGSTDNCAKIIKKYQKKYPKNIVYLYKENGGQASARNLGLKYMQENNYQTPWVTFTDPDDFLDRNYFYEVDKFLSTHQDDDICMVGCKVLLFWENLNKTTEHPLNSLKFINKQKPIFVFELNREIQAACRSFFLSNILHAKQIKFDDRINIFEDMKFVVEYLININPCSKIQFLDSSIYYLRKRTERNSTIDRAIDNLDFYLKTLQYGVLEVLKKTKNHSFLKKYICNVAFSQLIYNIRTVLEDKCKILSIQEKEDFLNLLINSFIYIEQKEILAFNFLGNSFFYKIGILNCFKKEKPPFQIVYIEDYDPYKEQILITYYTGDDKDVESIRIDDKEIYPNYEKIVKYDFLDRVFCYQKRLWVSIPKDAIDKLEIWINNTKSMIQWKNYLIEINAIRKKFDQLKANIHDIWLFIDRDVEADDNAEHLYRYIMQNHPEQKIVFALRKESPDWERLEKEGFNLIECYSKTFYDVASSVKYFISSHTPASFKVKLSSGQKFLFLGHGVDAADISKWFNTLNINVRFVSSKQEYDFIVKNYNNYILSKKEVVITGQPRHDTLLKNNKYNNKKILIMPTWRLYLVQDREITFNRHLVDNFFESEYYKNWFSFFNDPVFMYIVQKYKYQVDFVPHFNMRAILDKCVFPDFINISYRENNEPFQTKFQTSDILITDYTSAAFEMAYLKKPVIYYQFDKKEFFDNHSYKEGWFDYEKNGFGPVAYSKKDLLRNLENILKNNCLTDDIYKNNINSLFLFIDQENSKRIFNVISKLDIYEEI
ncbi:TPA: bifunctional glycosyltransferase family 2 protein/CDP-glycerol:glycerophosphate glycerophosphotransferase [Campylobacter lari]|uniref:bifunctional glycosyltransferase family 2 protein/CDP-glycerol:glycerophosphate glycerophosphotransferase n=1 Tax=Campylobacter lari TaxID=201 RepID=UPI0021F79D02|nr:bifunctional glycosyltransferase family 2 protein/CDP-glycerol:glycerophosphate glycerophosphotransferase [Campylobacter lari]MCW0256148.1 bifunctional glycosyltransferase family 2 protein/CDP-glycerol:glycerophosphate glycerophosphotransferase [Campylobacter lari]